MSGRFFVSEVMNVIQEVTAGSPRPVALHEPRFKGNEWIYIKNCIDTGWVSSVGSYVTEFEKKIASFTGSAYAVSTTNGTAALQMTCVLAGVKPGEEVLVPALTFVATANAVAYTGAVPHFMDSEEATLGVDPLKLLDYLRDRVRMTSDGPIHSETGRRIRALIAMHTFGYPVELFKLMEVCQEFRIELIEDAAESLGSYLRDRHTGTFSRLGALSFNGNKIVTTGGGGAILVQDEQLAKRAKHLTTTAKRPHPWEFFHDEMGYNFRLPNLNAALGCAQLESLPEFLAAKRRLAERYSSYFDSVQGLRFLKERSGTKSNYWLNTILLDENHAHYRDEILSAGHEVGIQLRPTWNLVSDLPMYSSSPRMDLSCARNLAGRIINLPSSVIIEENHNGGAP